MSPFFRFSFAVLTCTTAFACSVGESPGNLTPIDSGQGDQGALDTSSSDTGSDSGAEAPVDSADTGADEADTKDTGAAKCAVKGDCRTFASSSGCVPDVAACTCFAFDKTEKDAVCKGSPCLVDPCKGKSADCVLGTCVVK